MSSKLSPYTFDIGRYFRLIARPNVGRWSKDRGPRDDVFPQSGLIHLPQAVPPQLCEQAVAEYAEFEAFRRRRGCAVEDTLQRHYRVANLHLQSVAMRKVGLSRVFHDFAQRFFGAPSTVYTSLYFKHGSQQSPHIDTPFFWTRPFNLFVGVWVALEDVSVDAGPLIYYPGSHLLFNTEDALREVFLQSGGDVQRMFSLMKTTVEQQCAAEPVLIRRGDAVIWHPGLMHGGSQATRSAATRHSNVFHLSPLGVNVRDHRVFPRNFINLPKYGIVEESGAYYCRGALPAAMV